MQQIPNLAALPTLAMPLPQQGLSAPAASPWGMPPAPNVSFGTAPEPLPDLREMVEKFAVDYVSPRDYLKPWLVAVQERVSGAANLRKLTQESMNLALQGVSIEEQEERARVQATQAKAAELLEETAKLDDSTFNAYVERMRAAMSEAAPRLPEPTRPTMPSDAQLAIAGLGALISPQHAFDTLSMPFQYQAQEAARQDAQNLQEYQLDAQQRERMQRMDAELLEMQARRDQLNASLRSDALNRQVTLQGQRESSLRGVSNDLNAQATTVAQVQANLAGFEATYQRLGVPLPEGWEATREQLLEGARLKETEAADAKRLNEDMRAVQRYLHDGGDETRIPTSRATDVAVAKALLIKHWDASNPAFQAAMDRVNQLEAVVGRPSQKQIDAHQKQLDSTQGAKDRHALTLKKLVALDDQHAMMKRKLAISDKELAHWDEEFQARMIKRRWDIANVQSTIAKRKLDGQNAIAKAQAGKVDDGDRKALKDESTALGKETSLINAQVASLDRQMVMSNDPQRKSLNQRLEQIKARQREIGEALSVDFRKDANTAAAASSQAAGLYGINPTNANERAVLDQARAAIKAGKDERSVRELTSSLIRKLRGKN